MEENKKLAGQVILEHDSLRLDLEDDPIEYRKAMEPNLIQSLYDTGLKVKDHELYRGKDFYIVLVMTTCRVLRQPKFIPIARRSCPTPVYKQSVWKYRTKSGTLEFLWSIPSEILYYHILRNQVKYLSDKETADLAKFVILMESGEMLKWVKKENDHKIDAVIKINNQENLCLMN